MSSSFLSRELRAARDCEVFISSGSDVADERDMVRRAFEAAGNTLRQEVRGLDSPRIAVVTWEDAVARRRGKRVNDAFVQLATESHLTVVIVRHKLPPGTAEELEAVINRREVQIALIHIEEDSRDVDEDVEELLSRLRTEEILYRKVQGRDNQLDFVSAVTGVVAATLISILLEGIEEATSP